jgi:hypothetical protein
MTRSASRHVCRYSVRNARRALLGLLSTLVVVSCGRETIAPLVPGSPSTLSVIAGDGQTVPAGTRLPIPLTAVVRDSVGVRVPGVAVQFTTADNGAYLPIALVKTDSIGEAALVDWIPPGAAGIHHV